MNSLSPSMCLTAFAPGTTSPSIAVVRKILLPQTIGDECPRPAIGVFHLMFLVGVHSAGRFFSFEMPEPSGPRHCGQFAAKPTVVSDITATKARLIMRDTLGVFIREGFTNLILCCSIRFYLCFRRRKDAKPFAQ